MHHVNRENYICIYIYIYLITYLRRWQSDDWFLVWQMRGKCHKFTSQNSNQEEQLHINLLIISHTPKHKRIGSDREHCPRYFYLILFFKNLSDGENIYMYIYYCVVRVSYTWVGNASQEVRSPWLYVRN